MKQELTIKTRVTKDAPEAETKLTLDWTNATREQLIAFAQRSIIIALQSIYRTSGKVPATDTCDVAEFASRPRGAGGFKVTPENMAARAAKMSDDDYRATLVALGLPDGEVNKMVAKRAKVNGAA